ncbi:MAG: hypothetical protein ACKVOF_04075 [Pseudohongiellaceae bacterium]
MWIGGRPFHVSLLEYSSILLQLMPMLSLLFFLLLMVVIVLVTRLLRKNELRRTQDTADRTAPLPAIGRNQLAGFLSPPPTEKNSIVTARNSETWLLQVKSLRGRGMYADALQLCESHFPRMQAIQQAAIILRLLIKICLEQHHTFDSYLQALYRTAAIADQFRNATKSTPAQVQMILGELQNIHEFYSALGHRELKLLIKNDVRLLERVWGVPTTHLHVDDISKYE